MDQSASTYRVKQEVGARYHMVEHPSGLTLQSDGGCNQEAVGRSRKRPPIGLHLLDLQQYLDKSHCPAISPPRFDAVPSFHPFIRQCNPSTGTRH